ncbi:MAG: hypothetical protein SNF33_02390 [Candidatus Algichlamydia australiensis]|nr:hypothetical protein [Chlamydiales bacterium]
MGHASEALADKHQNWWHLSSIQLAGGVISLPFILIGFQVFSIHGTTAATLYIIFANLIGLIISYFFVIMSESKRLNAVENIKQFTGSLAGRLAAFFILVDTIGWIALGLFDGQKYLQNYEIFSGFSIALITGAAGSLVLLGGIKGLKKISVSTIIPLIVFASFIISSVMTKTTTLGIPPKTENHFFGVSGISIVLASSIAAIIDYPTFFRHSQSRKNSVIALLLVFLFTSLIQIAGVFLFKELNNENSIIKLLVSDKYISFVLIMFLIVSMITTTSWNAYAASVGWESLFPVFKDKTEYAVIGLVVAVILGVPQIEQFILSITILVNSVLSALGGVIVFQFINKTGKIFPRNHLNKKNDKIWNNFSWFFSSIIGMLSFFDIFTLKIDATIATLVFGFLFSLLADQTRQIYGWLVNR